jgi:hypothetical protein
VPVRHGKGSAPSPLPGCLPLKRLEKDSSQKTLLSGRCPPAAWEPSGTGTISRAELEQTVLTCCLGLTMCTEIVIGSSVPASCLLVRRPFVLRACRQARHHPDRSPRGPCCAVTVISEHPADEPPTAGRSSCSGSRPSPSLVDVDGRHGPPFGHGWLKAPLVHQTGRRPGPVRDTGCVRTGSKQISQCQPCVLPARQPRSGPVNRTARDRAARRSSSMRSDGTPGA